MLLFATSLSRFLKYIGWRKNFEDADGEYIEKIVLELKMMCNIAKKENIDIG